MPAKHFGYRPDPHDPRDFLHSERLGAPLQATRTENLDMLEHILEVLDQGPVGSCVEHGGFGAVRVKHSVSGIENPDLGARGPGYYILRGYLGTELEDSGGYIRDFFRGLNKYGFARDRDYPYDPEALADAFLRGDAPPDKPPPEFFRDAFDQRLPAVYSRITSLGSQRVAELKAAIDARNPIVFGALVGYDFLDWRGAIETPCPLNTGGLAGGHCCYAVGYNTAGLVCVNSWGAHWGDKGKFAISWDDVLRGSVDDLIDVWVVERAPYYSDEVAA